MRKTWIAMCTVAVVAAAGGLVAGRAFAEDDPMGGGGGPPPLEKAIDGGALVKALTANAWTTKSTSDQGNGEGTNSYRLAAGKTVLVQDYVSAMTDKQGQKHEFAGHGVYKWSADGKTVSLWWFDVMSPQAQVFTGSATDTGYELTSDMGAGGKAVIKLTKKGDTFEFTYTMGGALMFTDVYSKAK